MTFQILPVDERFLRQVLQPGHAEILQFVNAAEDIRKRLVQQ